MNDTVYTEKELMVRWKCGREAILSARRSHSLPFIRLGRLVRFRAEDVVAFEERNMSTAGEVVSISTGPEQLGELT